MEVGRYKERQKDSKLFRVVLPNAEIGVLYGFGYQPDKHRLLELQAVLDDGLWIAARYRVAYRPYRTHAPLPLS